jgi:hypothetical protein
MRRSLARNRQYRGYRSQAYRASDVITMANDELNILEESLYVLKNILSDSAQRKAFSASLYHKAIVQAKEAAAAAVDEGVAETYNDLVTELSNIYEISVSLSYFFRDFQPLTYQGLDKEISKARVSLGILEDYREDGIV